MIPRFDTSGSKLAWRQPSVSDLNVFRTDVRSCHVLYPSRRKKSPFSCSSSNMTCSFLPNFTGTALLFVKAYVELYAGKIQKKKISYKTFPQSTHACMVFTLLSSISFHIALWPVYASGSMVVMFLVGIFILNFCLLMPTYVQNLVAFVLLTFFLQEYS